MEKRIKRGQFKQIVTLSALLFQSGLDAVKKLALQTKIDNNLKGMKHIRGGITSTPSRIKKKRNRIKSEMAFQSRKRNR